MFCLDRTASPAACGQRGGSRRLEMGFLRSAPGLRPVLHWDDPDPAGSITIFPLFVEQNGAPPLGNRRADRRRAAAGSISNVAAAPSTAFAYDQKIAGSKTTSFLRGRSPRMKESPAGRNCDGSWLPTGFRGEWPFKHDGPAWKRKVGNNGLTFPRRFAWTRPKRSPLGSRSWLRAGGE